MNYHMPLFRPPSEAESLILQVTLGCSHNRCTFCSMYRTKRFRPRAQAELEGEIREARDLMGQDVRRIFLADGDALCLSADRLNRLLDPINRAFPRLQRISAYANARDVLRKSNHELERLVEGKLRLLYMGLESGDPETLNRVEKGASPDEIVEAVNRAQSAGMTVSVMVLIGLGGRERSLEHARASAEAINRMSPTFTALLTYTPVPGTPFHDDLEAGRADLPTPEGSLTEIHQFLSGLTCATIFSCNHASNYLPLRGKLPGGKERMLELLSAAMRGEVPLKPEFMRGL